MPAPALAAANALDKATGRRASGLLKKGGLCAAAGVVLVVGGFSDMTAKAFHKGDAMRAAAIVKYPPPPGLATAAADAARLSHVDARYLLAIAYIETTYGRHTAPRADLAGPLGDTIPADVRGHIHDDRLGVGAATPQMLALPADRAIQLGDWVNPAAAAGTGEHAMGFTQFTPTTWRGYAAQGASVLGHEPDPYDPTDAMTMTGLKVFADVRAEGGDLLMGLSHYNNLAEARQILEIANYVAFTAGNPLLCDQPALTQGYGPVDYIFEPRVGNAPHFHTGADLACAEGTQVVSLTDGIAHVHPMSRDGYGNVVSIETGRFFIRYCHLDLIAVKEGAVVRAGDVIGLEGNTGASRGAHLHFEVDEGADSYLNSVNPFSLLDKTKITNSASQGITWGS